LVLLVALAGVCLFGFLDPPAYGLAANPMMLQFAAGAWLGRRHMLERRWEPGAGLVLGGLGVLALGALFLGAIRSEFWRPLLWGAPAVLIVGGAVAWEQGRAFKAPAALTRLGDASYAIYLCHMPAVALVAHGLGVHPAALFVPTAVAASLAVGLLFHLAVETPLIGACRALPGRLRGFGAARARPG
jgi:exopolysaccharide production protein ExoZ